MKRSLLLCALLLIGARGAAATTPSNGNSISPPCIWLVGLSGGAPARSMGQFSVFARDLANNPVPQALITVDLSGIPEAVLAIEQYDPQVTVDCVRHRVSKLADANGEARFTVVGASHGGDPSVFTGGGKIYENGRLIGSPTVSMFDLDGVSGVGANDLSLWFGDFGSTAPWGRSDYDCSGGIGANDLSVWLSAYGSGLMSESGAPACP